MDHFALRVPEHAAALSQEPPLPAAAAAPAEGGGAVRGIKTLRGCSETPPFPRIC